jgi:predicted methyltransferase MtxX (methanogen marker protein 4)
MSGNNTAKKLGKLLLEYLEEISSDENSEAYLKEQGVDPDQLVKESIRKIKLAKMKLASNSTQKEFALIQSNLLADVKAEVDKLLADVAFNLAAFIKKESINVSYRNFEEMSKDEIRQFLERHYLLKARNKSKDE